MRVGQNFSYFAGDTQNADRNGKTTEKAGMTRGSLFAGNLNQTIDPIAKKKQEARKQAAKVVSDVFAREQTIDDDIKARYQKISDSQDLKKEALDKLKDIDASKAALKESYGVTDDSQEQQDLLLLEKRRQYQTSGKISEMPSPEESKRLAEIDAQGLTEYQQRALELNAEADPYKKEMKDANDVIVQESETIRSIKLSRLKSTAILDASKSADQIMESASKEAISMLVEEAKNKTDQENAEEEEKIQKRKEEKEEFEKRLEDIRTENEQLTPQNKQSAAADRTSSTDRTAEQLTELATNKDDMQRELDKLKNEMQLTDEDLTGLQVDAKL